MRKKYCESCRFSVTALFHFSNKFHKSLSVKKSSRELFVEIQEELRKTILIKIFLKVGANFQCPHIIFLKILRFCVLQASGICFCYLLINHISYLRVMTPPQLSNYIFKCCFVTGNYAHTFLSRIPSMKDKINGITLKKN